MLWERKLDLNLCFKTRKLIKTHFEPRAELHVWSGQLGNNLFCASDNRVALILQDLKRVLSFPPYSGDYLHPVVYACTAVMLLCLLVSIMTYIIHHRWVTQIVWTVVCFKRLLQFTVYISIYVHWDRCFSPLKIAFKLCNSTWNSFTLVKPVWMALVCLSKMYRGNWNG